MKTIQFCKILAHHCPCFSVFLHTFSTELTRFDTFSSLVYLYLFELMQAVMLLLCHVSDESHLNASKAFQLTQFHGMFTIYCQIFPPRADQAVQMREDTQ